MIRIEKVNKYFNRFRKNQLHVINNTSLTLEDSGLVALLGPSGSGKTTLLNAIGGLDKVNKGNIYINNQKITSKLSYKVDKIRNLNIGYIFQDYKLIGDLSVFDNVALVLKMIGIKNKKEIEEKVNYVLEKVGMYRYRRRPANMLSGGERQRVGIARALVKNPNIIIADEPTGNLDSKNSLEVMNIIRAISKDRLVILVTHEVNLAKFYASRIIEINDGKVEADYENTETQELEYSIDNRFYLKDFKNKEEITEKNNNITIYSDKKEKLNLEIVIKNNNIYISSKNSNIEVVDDHSNFEFVDDNYKNISLEEVDKYNFDRSKLENHKPLHYTSIFNPLTFITNGFSKVFNYSIIKKILLIGFFLSGAFITFACSRIVATTTIHDKDFLEVNRNYLAAETPKITKEEYDTYKNTPGVSYILPTNSIVTINMLIDNYYQTANNTYSLTGSLTDSAILKQEDLKLGRLPENNYEIVVDKMVIDRAKEESQLAIMAGILKTKDYLGRSIRFDGLDTFKIVGITDNENPLIYANQEMFINIVYNSLGASNNTSSYSESPSAKTYQDFNLFSNKISLVKGRAPTNDYEVVVNESLKETMPLNKEIDKKINNHKLLVVGYYTSADPLETYLVNQNMILLETLKKTKDIVIYPEEEKHDEVLNALQSSNKVNIYDTYTKSKDKFISSKKDGIKNSLIAAGLIIVISLIEIFLMIRASFLSRVKEVGTYRAIGVKKKDIYIMFSGEIVAITVLACIPGVCLSAYLLNILSGVSFLSREITINLPIVLTACLIISVFNLIIGLLPVYITLRKRPAAILSRTDV